MGFRVFLRGLLGLFFALVGVSSSVSPVVPGLVLAAPDDRSDEEAKRKEFFDGVKGAGFTNSGSGYVDRFERDGRRSVKDDSVFYALQYLLTKGYYVSDINNYVDPGASGQDNSVVHRVNGRWTVCGFKDEPQNLLNHNCDIPAFGTEFLQSVTRVFSSQGIVGQQRTPASLGVLGFGAPVSVPNGRVPVNPGERTEQYTALELFGYDLFFTSYLGEFDDVVPSTQARLLSNVGFWGELRVAGGSIWNGVSNVLSKWFNGWVFGPSKYSRKMPGFIDGVVSSVVDSSDFNVVASHSWKRPFFGDTLYNVYYMSDKEVVEKASADYFRFIVDNLYGELEGDPQAQEVLFLMPGGKHFPVFRFDAGLYTEASKKKVADWEKCSKGKVNARSSCGKKPSLEVVPEREQFEAWKGQAYQRDFDARAKAQGIDCFAAASSYDQLTSCYSSPFTEYARKTFNHDNRLVQSAIARVKNRFLDDNPFSDPNRGLSHYVIADGEGRPVGGSLGEWRYYYTGENSRFGESVAEGAAPVRPSVKGAKYGSGEPSNDTRWLHYVNGGSELSSGVGVLSAAGRGVARFSARATNFLLTVAFSNFVESLGLDKVIETSVGSFRDSLFFPFVVLLAALFGVWLVFRAFSVGVGVVRSVGVFVLVFFAGTVLLFNVGKVVKWAEDVPSMIDGAVSGLILEKTGVSEFCGASGADADVRRMQCAVWDVVVFQPWLHGQFGVGYGELAPGKFSNKNGDLVGDAPVDMGGGKVLHNWGLWQVSKMKSGTITDDDPVNVSGSSSKELYKLVDLQAGPDGGRLSDARVFPVWSGLVGGRDAAMVASGFVGVMVLVTVGALALAKIELAFELLFRILLFPVVVLTGLLPGRQFKLAEYGQQIVDLLVKRLFLSGLLSLVLVLLSNISGSGVDYRAVAVYSVALLVGVYMYWRELVGLVSSSSAGVVGSLRKRLAPSAWLPKSLNMWYQQGKEKLVAGVPGAVGGAVVAGLKAKGLRDAGVEVAGGLLREGARFGAARNTDRASGRLFKAQAREGFGLLNQFAQARAAGRSEGVYGRLARPSVKLRSNVRLACGVIENRVGEFEAVVSRLEAEGAGLTADGARELAEARAGLAKYRGALDRINSVASGSGSWRSSGDVRVDGLVANLDFGRAVAKGDRVEAESVEERVERLVDELDSVPVAEVVSDSEGEGLLSGLRDVVGGKLSEVRDGLIPDSVAGERAADAELARVASEVLKGNKSGGVLHDLKADSIERMVKAQADGLFDNGRGVYGENVSRFNAAAEGVVEDYVDYLNMVASGLELSKGSEAERIIDEERRGSVRGGLSSRVSRERRRRVLRDLVDRERKVLPDLDDGSER